MRDVGRFTLLMDRLAAANVRFGIAYCISRESLVDMPWAVEFAEAKGASLIQFHPFAATGRGQKLADRLSLRKADKTRAYLITRLLDMGDGPIIHLDFASVEEALMRRNDYNALILDDAANTLLSDLVNPLIIDETGLMLPLSYGVNEQFSLGRLKPNISESIAYYKEIRVVPRNK